MQLLCETDIDAAIREFESAAGDLFRQERIKHLRARVAELDRQHQNSAIVRRKLVLAMADQLNREATCKT